MATSKRKFTRLNTPAGRSVFPKLNTPDTKYKPLGEYATKLVLTGEEAQPIIDKYEAELAAYFDEVKAELMKGDGKSKVKAKALKFAADKPYKPEVDDEGDETGNVVFNAKMPARIAREGKEDLILKPDFFDAAGKKLVKVPEIWGGSKLILALELRPFNAPIGVGISLRLTAVQIVELRSGGQRDAGAYGFGAVEGGYSGAESKPAADDDTDGDDTAGDDTTGGDGTSDNGDF